MSARALIRVLRTLTPPGIEEILVRDRVIRRAQAYAAEGRVDEVWVERNALRAHVEGSSDTPYHCVIRLHEGRIEAECSCPYERGLCWHVGSVLLVLAADTELLDELEDQISRRVAEAAPVEEPGGEAAPPARSDDAAGAAAEELARREQYATRLLAWPKARLVEQLTDLMLGDPLVESTVLRHEEEPTQLDIRLFRQAGRTALRQGTPLNRYEVARVASDLRDIVASVRRLVGGGQPEAALDLLQELAGLAWTRVGEVDDRDEALVGFVREALQIWVDGWSEIDGRDRQRLARELFGWLMEDGGTVTQGLVLEAKKALGPIGLDTLTGLLEPVYEERLKNRPLLEAPEQSQTLVDPVVDRVRAALRETSEARGDLEEYLRYCDPSGAHGGDVLDAARRLEREGRLEEALLWVDRGRRRARGTVRAEMEDRRIALLARLGRRREAIEAAWTSFVSEPGVHAYARLQRTVDEQERGAWRGRAIDHVEASSDATAFVEICLAAHEAERLAHRLDATPGFVLSASTSSLERAVVMLDERNAWACARVHFHLATRWLAEGDARHYARVRHHLEQARRAHEADGSTEAWQEQIEQMRRAHAVVGAWFTES